MPRQAVSAHDAGELRRFEEIRRVFVLFFLIRSRSQRGEFQEESTSLSEVPQCGETLHQEQTFVKLKLIAYPAKARNSIPTDAGSGI